MTVFKIWFLSLFLGQSEIFLFFFFIKSSLPTRYVHYFLTVLSTQMFYHDVASTTGALGCVMQALTSQKTTDLTLPDLHKQISFKVWKSGAHKERNGSKPATVPRSGKQDPRFVLLVHSGTKLPPERKRRKILMCPRCKLKV